MHTQSWWHFVCTEYHGQMVMSKHMLQNRIYIDGPIRTCSDNRHRSVLWRELGMRTKKSKQITIDFPALIDCADVYPRLKCSFFLFQLFPGQVSSFYNYFPANQRLKTIPFIMFITTLDLHSETESETAQMWRHWRWDLDLHHSKFKYERWNEEKKAGRAPGQLKQRQVSQCSMMIARFCTTPLTDHQSDPIRYFALLALI